MMAARSATGLRNDETSLTNMQIEEVFGPNRSGRTSCRYGPDRRARGCEVVRTYSILQPVGMATV